MQNTTNVNGVLPKVSKTYQSSSWPSRVFCRALPLASSALHQDAWAEVPDVCHRANVSRMQSAMSAVREWRAVVWQAPYHEVRQARECTSACEKVLSWVRRSFFQSLGPQPLIGCEFGGFGKRPVSLTRVFQFSVAVRIRSDSWHHQKPDPVLALSELIHYVTALGTLS